MPPGPPAIWRGCCDLRLDEAAGIVAEAVDLAEEAEFFGFLRYLQVISGIIHLARAAWGEAEREASWGLDAPSRTRTPALYVIGRARARRGDRSGRDLIEEAFVAAVELREPQRVAPAGSVLLEAAWLDGYRPALAEAAARVLPRYDEVFTYGYPPVVAELAYWLGVAGHPVAVPEIEDPYAHLAAGRWREAATRWEQAGCPYEQALALSHSPSADDVLTALSILDGIRAVPLARLLRERLRAMGVARVPRGPAPSTRDNPAGLTDRQVEVLRLLAAGLTNPEIAARLVLSVRTVDSHVAAILTKLDAATRRDAAREAARLGLLAPPDAADGPSSGPSGS